MLWFLRIKITIKNSFWVCLKGRGGKRSVYWFFYSKSTFCVDGGVASSVQMSAADIMMVETEFICFLGTGKLKLYFLCVLNLKCVINID